MDKTQIESAIRTVKFCLGTMDKPCEYFDVKNIDKIVWSGKYLTHVSPFQLALGSILIRVCKRVGQYSRKIFINSI